MGAVAGGAGGGPPCSGVAARRWGSPEEGRLRAPPNRHGDCSLLLLSLCFLTDTVASRPAPLDRLLRGRRVAVLHGHVLRAVVSAAGGSTA